MKKKSFLHSPFAFRLPTFPRDNFRSVAALTRFAGTTILGLAADLASKYWAELRLTNPPRDIQIIPDWLHFHYTENWGAAMGTLQGQRALFLCISVLAIGFLTWLFANSSRQRFYQVLLGILLAGVLGNMYDRVVYGHVRDMIYILPKWDVFPWIFNVADTLLCVGVALLIVQGWFGEKVPPMSSSAV